MTSEERTGGWMLTGPEGRIKVSLLGPDDPASPSLEANLTSSPSPEVNLTSSLSPEANLTLS